MLVVISIVSSWKDILFSGVMLLLVLFLYHLATGTGSLKRNITGINKEIFRKS